MNEPQERKARGICIKDGKILVIKRLNLERETEQEYFVLPGGEIEENESIEGAILRETLEETGIRVELGEEFLTFVNDDTDIEEHFYLCKYVNGSPALSINSEEAKEMRKGINFYTPMWVSIDDLKKIRLYPEKVKEMILERFL